MVNFPNSLDTWTDVTDDVDVVDDDHMNDAHNSIIAIENILNLMDSALSEWKVEKDYIDGFEISRSSNTECILTSGTVAVAGKLFFKNSTTTLNITSDLRSGESEESTQLYNIYCYISGSSLIFKFSAIDPNPDFSHPNETGWRAITLITNVNWHFYAIKQHGDFISLPSVPIYTGNPTGAYQSVNLADFLPNFASEVKFLLVGTANAGGNIQIQTGAAGNTNETQNEMRIASQPVNSALTQTQHCVLDTQYLHFIAHSANWMGIYLTGAFLKRRRS